MECILSGYSDLYIQLQGERYGKVDQLARVSLGVPDRSRTQPALLLLHKTNILICV